MFIGSYSAKSPSFVAHSNAAKAVRAAIGDATVSLSSYAASYSNDAFRGVVATEGSKCILIPYTSGALVEFDSEDGTMREIPLPRNIPSAAFYGGCRTDNGLVIMTPLLANHFLVYSIERGTASAVDEIEGTSYNGGCQGKDGIVYLAPRTDSVFGTFNPYTMQPGTGVDLGDDGFRCCQAMADGRIMFIPYGANRPTIYDPETGEVTQGEDITANSAAFVGGATFFNGDIALVPYSNRKLGIYRADGGGYYRPVFDEDFISAAFLGGAVLPDGTLLMAPYDETVVGRYDPYTDAYSEVTGVPSSSSESKYSGAATLANGKVVMAPFNSGNVLVASIPGDYDLQWPLSRFWASC